MVTRADGHLKRGREKYGFTLMELIVVVSILAAITMMVMPIYHDTFQTVKIDDSINSFFSTMQYAGSIAISEAREYRMYFVPEENAYWLATLEADAKGEWAYDAVLDGYSDVHYLPYGLSFGRPKAYKDPSLKGAYYVSFFPSGACDAVTIPIEKDNERFRGYEITTQGRSGRLELIKP